MVLLPDLILFFAALTFLHRSVLTEEQPCLQQYGESYKAFMQKAPRYFLFKC